MFIFVLLLLFYHKFWKKAIHLEKFKQQKYSKSFIENKKCMTAKEDKKEPAKNFKSLSIYFLYFIEIVAFIFVYFVYVFYIALYRKIW